MRKILAISLMFLCACGTIKKPVPPVEVSPGWYAVDVGTDKKPEEFQAVAGAEKKDIEMIVDVPPSKDHVFIQIYDKPIPFWDHFKPSNKPKHTVVTRSTDTKAAQDVKPEQPHESVWWWWVGVAFLSLVFVFVVALVIYSKLKSLSPIGILKSLLSRFF